jgi:uncharacterized protein
MKDESILGRAMWLDLTVENATELRDFYAAVIGWSYAGLQVEDHEDFVMGTASGESIAGVCHRLGPNAGIPPVWVPYFVVADLAASLAEAKRRGATEIAGDLETGYVLLRDPAGAVFALSVPQNP